jgi:hypothetical protein
VTHSNQKNYIRHIRDSLGGKVSKFWVEEKYHGGKKDSKDRTGTRAINKRTGTSFPENGYSHRILKEVNLLDFTNEDSKHMSPVELTLFNYVSQLRNSTLKHKHIS